MSYNLLNGGHDSSDDVSGGGGSAGSDRDLRWRTQVEIVNEVAPDVLLVQEARGFDADGARLLYETEHALGMRGLLAPAPRTGQHTAVFLRPHIRPLRFDPDSEHFHHALAQATLAVPGFTQPVTVASVHLSPLHPALRLAEVGWLAGLAAPDRFAIIAGDANSLAPGDPEPPDWHQLPAHHRVRYLAPAPSTHPDQPVAPDQPARSDRSALAFLHRAGFTDAAATRGDLTATVPAAGFPQAEFVAFRCDHVLLSPRLAPQLTSYRVVDDARTARASDHLPTVIEVTPT